MSTVGNLYFSGRPAAVAGGIRTIIVDAVESKVRVRTVTYVGKKDFKAWIFFFNSSSAIIFISWISRIIASLAQGIPSRIFGCFFMINAVAVFLGKFYSKTPTRLSISFPQIYAEDNASVSAVALTKPTAKIALTIYKRKGNKAPKALISNVDTFGHIT